MPFDPNAPFEVEGAAPAGAGGGFDPNAPFEIEGGDQGGDGAADYLGALFGGFNKGLGTLVDLTANGINSLTQAPNTPDPKAPHGGISPLDPARQIFSRLGIPQIDKPFLGREWWKDSRFVPKTPDTAAGRVIDRIGEEVGAAALPGAAILKKATMAKEIPAAAKTFLDAIARTPGKAAVGETLASVGSGTGAGIAREIAPDSPTAELAGQMIGGLTPTAFANSLTGLAARSVAPAVRIGTRTVKRALGDPEALMPTAGETAKGRAAVKDFLGRELPPETSDALDEADRLRKAMPGFDPSLGEATGRQSLLTQQKTLEATSTGQELDRIVGRKKSSEAAVARFENDAAPVGDANPDFVIDSARGRVNGLQDKVETQLDATRAKRVDLAESKFPIVDRAEQGRVIREQLGEERAARRAKVDELSKSLGLDDVDLTAPFAQASKDLVAEFSPTSVFDDMANYPEILSQIKKAGAGTAATPGTPTGLLDKYGADITRGGEAAKPAKITFKDMKALRERVSDDLIDALGPSGSKKKVKMLITLKNRVDELTNTLTQSADPTLSARYADFRKTYFDDYIKPFEQGAAFKARRMTGQGFYQTTDEKVADLFFKPGDTTSADQFNALFKGRPEAGAAIEASALDSLRESAVRDGVIDPGRFETWKRSHRAVLEKFPELNAKLASTETADAAYIGRQEQLARRQTGIENRILTKMLASHANGQTADAVISGALTEPRKMAQLIGAARRTDGALPALRRIVWNKAVGGDAESMVKFMGQHGPALKQLFGEKHLNDIASITSARAMLQRVPTPTGAAYTPRPFGEIEKILGQGIPQFSSRVFAFKSGRVPKGYLIVDSVMRGLRGRAKISADDALRAALYDVNVARDMREAIETLKFNPEKARRLRGRVIALGIPLLDREDESEAEPAPAPESGPGAIESMLPSSVRAFGSTLLGSRSPITENFFTKDELETIRKGAEVGLNNKRKPGVFGYGDYGEKDPWSEKSSQFVNALTDPGGSMANTLGMARAKLDEDGSVTVSDRYDWNAKPSEVAAMGPLDTVGHLLKAFQANGLIGVGNVVGNLATGGAGGGRPVNIRLPPRPVKTARKD